MDRRRKNEIELMTMRILDQYNIKDNPGKHLRTITDGEQITLVDYDKWEGEECGRFMYVNTEPVIFYNVKHTEEIQAFTIAHELGHYFLKHLDDSQPETICLNRDFQRTDDSDDERQQHEVEANYFAACLLLPMNLLLPVFSEFLKRNNRTRPLYVDLQQCNFRDYKLCITNIQLSFLASQTAIRIRLIQLGWMEFNIKTVPAADRGISIAEYLKKHRVGTD